MTARRLFLLTFVASLLTAFGCSGGGDGGTEPAHLSCADGGQAAADSVSMTCGGAMSAKAELVKVVVGGPAAGNTTVRGFNFDVTYDPAKLEFVPAASYTSPLMPNALIAVTLFNGQQGRVVVSVQQPGTLGDVAIGPGQSTLLSLSIQRAAGATFGPTPLAFENTQATGASSPIAFSSSIRLAYR